MKLDFFTKHIRFKKMTKVENQPFRQVIRKLLCFGIAFAICSTLCAADTGRGNDVKSYIVTLWRDVEPKGFAQQIGAAPRHVYKRAINGFAVSLNENAVQRLRNDKRVRFVEPDGHVTFCDQTTGAGVVRMGLTNFPVAQLNGNDERVDIGVAILDSGIDTNHPDLNVVNAWGARNYWDGSDPLGHGTHVAGIVGAKDNGIGVVGVAPGARLWSVQVVGWDQFGFYIDGTWSDVIAGIDYIAQHTNEISVVNASLASTPSDPVPAPYYALRAAVQSLVTNGIVFVAAAGNNGIDIAGADGVFGPVDESETCDDIVPVSYPEVMGVTSMNPATDQLASDSNYSSAARATNYVSSTGMAVDVAAPGVDIYSTYPGGAYGFGTGTSMAAPHVAGLVALYIAANGRAHNEQEVYAIRQAIINNSLPQSSWNTTNTLDPDSNHERLAIASQNWIPTPKFSSVNKTSGLVQLSIPAVPGYNYTVERKQTLNSSWVPLTTVSSTGSVTTVIATDGITNTSGFYRLNRQPAP